MSEYWKSTPKYWCKHCSVYVRDTKLERANHEATGRHQGAIKRSLRELHRNHEQEEREKDRAKREVERLNGVVSGTGSSSSSRPGAGPSSTTKGGAYGSSAAVPKEALQAQRQSQLEQLSALGVEIPTELRPNMALAGDWTVTATRVIKEPGEDGQDSKDGMDDGPVEMRAKGVRKREAEETEEKKEENEAIKGLFKKRKTWGGSKAMPEADAELDALLGGGLPAKKEEAEDTKKIKTEEHEPQPPEGKPEASPTEAPIKPDPEEADTKTLADVPDGAGDAAPAASGIVFKKRKPKNVRQK